MRSHKAGAVGRIIGFGGVLALSAVSSPARAAQFRDAQTGLSLELDVPDAQVCVIRPASLRQQDACSGLDVDAVESNVATSLPSALGIAQIRDASGSFFLTLATTPFPSDQVSAKDLDEAVIGAEQAAREHSPGIRAYGTGPSSRYDEVAVTGAKAVRFVLATGSGTELPVGASIVTYFIFVKRAMFSLSVVTEPAQVVHARAIGDRILGTISLTPTSRLSAAQDHDVQTHKIGPSLAWGLAAGVAVLALACVSFLSRLRRPTGGMMSKHPEAGDDIFERSVGARKRRLAATTSCAFWILALTGGIIAHGMTPSDAQFAISVGGTGLIFAGVASAAFALVGVKAYGRKGILVPALVGLILNGAFVVMAVLN